MHEERNFSSEHLSTYTFKRHFFRHGSRIATKFGTHTRIETRLALTSNKFDQPHPILIETRSYRRPLYRPLYVDKSAMRRFASLFGEVLLYQHQRIVATTKVYIASNNLPVEIIRFHTIGFSDIWNSTPTCLSRIWNSTTTCLSRAVHFGR